MKTWDDGKLEWFIEKFKYDGIKKTSEAKKDSNSRKASESKDEDSQKAGSFAAYSSFTLNQDKYKLYNAWTLDNASDIHVCNDPDWSGFSKTRDATDKDKLFADKTSYTIEAFGTVTINIQTPQGR